MKKTALYVQAEASKRYSPYTLKDFLIRLEDGNVVVDRNSLIKSHEDLVFFYVILSKDYGWDYRYPETSTIYFEEVEGKVYGGVYELSLGRRSRRLIVTGSNNSPIGYDLVPYTYNAGTLLEIISRING